MFFLLPCYIDVILSIQVYNGQEGLSLERPQEPEVLHYILDIFNNLTNLYGRCTDKKLNKIFLIYRGNSEWSSCKVIYEEGLPNI